MTTNLDIFRTASVLIREHGVGAALEAAQRLILVPAQPVNQQRTIALGVEHLEPFPGSIFGFERAGSIHRVAAILNILDVDSHREAVAYRLLVIVPDSLPPTDRELIRR